MQQPSAREAIPVCRLVYQCGYHKQRGTSAPDARRASATIRPRSDRSTKKMYGSGSRTVAVLEADRVFDELRSQLVVVR